MLHEISPLRLDNAFYAHDVQNGDTILCFQGDALLLRNSGEGIAYPVFDAVKMDASRCIYLFSIDSQRFFLSFRPVWAPGFRFSPVQSLRTVVPQHMAFAGTIGHHLYRWYRARKYCGVCGRRAVHDKKERMLLCPACGNKEYPQIMPAVIVGVIDGNKLLLTKYAARGNQPSSQRQALVAGFTEIGETLEETVRREVREETGLEVGDITYYKSQPWAFTGSLLSGFFARVMGGNQVTLDEEELSQAVFVAREDIDVPYTNIALTNEMICLFRDLGPEPLLRDDPLRRMPYGQAEPGVQ